MKKSLNLTLIVIGVIIGIIIIDTIQARLFKKSPIISFKETLADDDSWVDRGLLMDTYYCTREQDIVKVSWHFKTAKFDCPIDNVTELKNYDFSVVVDSHSQHKKELAFTYDKNNYYYGNTKFELFLNDKNKNNKYSLESAIAKNLVSFEDILNKTDKVDMLWDGGSKIYHYNNFNIIVCNTLDGNKDIIIGDTEITSDKFCK